MSSNLIAKKAYSIPFIVWIIAGTVIPLASIAYYGFTSRDGGFTFDNVLAIFRHDHMQALGLSLLLAFISTAICLLLAFPMAMILRESRYGKQGFLIFVIILPMWMNFLLRTMAWQVLLERQGVINAVITAIGLPRQELMNTPGAIVLGMVYDFLPFMIYPIYNTLQKMDLSLIEAAKDLGARPKEVFTKVILPLSVPGIYSGIVMVFMPTVSTFAISELLTHNKITLFGSLIQRSFGEGGIAMWNYGAALSLIMLIIIGMTSFFGNNDTEDINR